jgi:putative ABC transport system substrate-binding protein
MNRREVITAVGGAATWPLAARAQQRLVPVIGVLSRISAAAAEANLVGFRKGLERDRLLRGAERRD